MASMEILHVTAKGVRSCGTIELGRKHGVYYGVRPLDRGGYRVHVVTYVNGRWIETNENSTPWAFKSIALARALEFAREAAGRYSPALLCIPEV